MQWNPIFELEDEVKRIKEEAEKAAKESEEECWEDGQATGDSNLAFMFTTSAFPGMTLTPYMMRRILMPSPA